MFKTAELTFWFFVLFFFLSSGIFQLWVTSVSVTGGLQTVLGSSWLWNTLAGQTIPVVLKAHLVVPTWEWLMKEHFPQGLCTVWLLRAPAHPSFPPLCQPWLEGSFFTTIAEARASLGVEDVQQQLPGSSLVPSARSLGVCSISKLPWSAHAKGFVLAVSLSLYLG